LCQNKKALPTAIKTVTGLKFKETNKAALRLLQDYFRSYFPLPTHFPKGCTSFNFQVLISVMWSNYL